MSSWQLNLNDVEAFEHLGSIHVTDQPSGMHLEFRRFQGFFRTKIEIQDFQGT